MALNGDEAIALAAKQCDVDVVAAYPITPQTIIVEKFSEYVANGEVKTEYVCTESEHSAMTACLAASSTGARTFTASASAGLALMHEMLFVTSGSRAPVVMAVANRALSAPLNIHGDHSDSMAERDSGWIHIYVENAQEAYDSIIQAFKIAEDVGAQRAVGIGNAAPGLDGAAGRIHGLVHHRNAPGEPRLRRVSGCEGAGLTRAHRRGLRTATRPPPFPGAPAPA